MKVKGERWKSGVTGKGPDYCKGVAEFIGVGTCKSERERAYTEGVNAVTAADFDAAIAGKEEKWARRYREKNVRVRGNPFIIRRDGGLNPLFF
jgi:hypothetical protein